MTMIRPVGDLSKGDHVVVGQQHEIAAGTYTVSSVEPLDEGRVRLSLAPDDDGDPVVGEYDGALDVGVN